MRRYAAVSTLLFFLTGLLHLQAQHYSYTLSTKEEKCTGGSADLQVEGLGPADKMEITWSTGETGFSTIKDLSEGSYSVNVRITFPQDTVMLVSDTTLPFSIVKVICPVSVPHHFSPNSDGYNDDLRMPLIEKHPNFDFQVFNRWGQMVHRQKKTYTPWTGQWLGTNLPDGTYYYILIYDADDKQNLQKGDITILR